MPVFASPAALHNGRGNLREGRGGNVILGRTSASKSATTCAGVRGPSEEHVVTPDETPLCLFHAPLWSVCMWRSRKLNNRVCPGIGFLFLKFCRINFSLTDH